MQPEIGLRYLKNDPFRAGSISDGSSANVLLSSVSFRCVSKLG